MVSEVKKCLGVHRVSTVFREKDSMNERNKTCPDITYREGSNLIPFCKGISEPRREERIL